MTLNKEKELRNRLKTLDKDQLIELLLQFKWDTELLQGLANDTLDAMNEKLVLEKALELACDAVINFDNVILGFPTIFATQEEVEEKAQDFIEQARESLKNGN